MTNKKRLAGFAVLLILVVVVVGFVIYTRKYQYSVCVIKSDQGWGYDILQGKRLIIHQPYMPAVNGQITFRDKNAARKTGQLVVKKIREKRLPTININEINAIIKSTD
jgi:uncharacterized membrane protein SpoIIM required for sporulation